MLICVKTFLVYSIIQLIQSIIFLLFKSMDPDQSLCDIRSSFWSDTL